MGLSFTTNQNLTMTDCYGQTYGIVSTVAYLLGVHERIFENEHESPRMDVFEKLEKDKSARIVRHLCMLRTAIERNFKYINEKMRFEYKGLTAIPEYVPVEAMNKLSLDGVSIKSGTRLSQYVVEINRLIMDRINNCKDLFPIWIKWEYLRDIFIMPNGLKEEGTKDAATVYYNNREYYPYQVYMNWSPSDQGNIFYNDKKFVSLLYQWNRDTFEDFSRVSDVRDTTKERIYDFIEDSNRTVIVVDCENADPYQFCATIRNLDPDVVEKISKIVLYDDVHSASGWKLFSKYVDVPVEHNLIDRVKKGKSLVDISLTAGTCKEFYQNNVDAFIIVSSDSDYWALISALPQANFLVMIEREKCGPDIKAALINSNIYYCYIDEFYSGTAEDIRTNALLVTIREHLDVAVQFNIYSLLDQALLSSRIKMDADEKKQFYNQYLSAIHMVIDEDGMARIELNKNK